MEYDVVIPHFARKNNSHQLRICLRSIRKNVSDTGRIFVVGDVPPWLGKDGVPLSRYRKGFGSKFIDQQRKLLHCLKTKPVSETFVFFHDDVYFLKPVSLAELQQPFVEPDFLHRAGEIWKTVFHLTLKFVEEKGGTSINYETHMPLVMNKNLCIRMLEDIGDRPVHIASAYFNLFPQPNRLPDVSIKRIRQDKDFEQAKIINTCPPSFEKIKDQLQNLFNHPSDVEYA